LKKRKTEETKKKIDENEPQDTQKPKRGQRGKRHPYFTKEKIEKVFQLAQRGLNDSEICEAIGISRCGFYKNMKKSPELRKAIYEGREKSIDNVENAHFKIALGYEYEEVTQIIKQVDGKDTKEIKKVKRHIAPNVTAQIFILKNRRPDKWKDRAVTEHDGKIDLVNHTATEINFVELTDEEIKKQLTQS
jgi:hypothetical protein